MSAIIEQEIPAFHDGMFILHEGNGLVTEITGKSEEVILTTINFMPVVAIERNGCRFAIAISQLSEKDRALVETYRQERNLRRVVQDTRYHLEENE